MTTKSSPSMIRRFSGKDGRRRLIECVSVQTCVAGNLALARELVTAGTLVDVKPGDRIAVQGDADNDLFFILAGSLASQ